MNQNSREGIDLFAIRLEVWRIGESRPAVRLNPVADPSEWKEKAKRTEGQLTETKKLQEQYWIQFRDLIESRDTPLRPRKPKPHHWYNNPIGKADCKLQFTVNTVENQLYTHLIIRKDPEIYQALESEKEEIEAEVGEPLIWSPPEEAKGESERGKITQSRSGVLANKDEWGDYQEWMLKRGERFYETFYDRIQQF